MQIIVYMVVSSSGLHFRNRTIIWICPSVCPFRISSGVHERIYLRFCRWESGLEPHWQCASTRKCNFFGKNEISYHFTGSGPNALCDHSIISWYMPLMHDYFFCQKWSKPKYYLSCFIAWKLHHNHDYHSFHKSCSIVQWFSHAVFFHCNLPLLLTIPTKYYCN